VARISKGGYFGLIDTKGKILIEPKYDKIFSFNKGVAKVGLNNKFGAINLSGKEILKPKSVIELSDFNNGLAIYKISNNHEKGVLNDKGEFIAEQKYNDLWFNNIGNLIYHDYAKKKIGFIDKEGREKVVFNLVNYTYYSTEMQAFELMKKLDFFEGLAITFQIKDSVKKFGFMNENLDVVIPPIYDWVSVFEHGYAQVSLNNSWGIINVKGELVIPIIYQSVKPVSKSHFIVKKDNRFGVIDMVNEIVIPIKYLKINYLAEGMYAVFKNEISSEENFEDYYLYSGTMEEQVYDGVFGSNWGVINEENKQVLPFEYDDFDWIENENRGIAYRFYEAFYAPIGSVAGTRFGNGYYFDNSGVLETDSFIINQGFWNWNYSNIVTTKDYSFKIDGGYSIVGELSDTNAILSMYKSGFHYFNDNLYLVGVVNNKGDTIIPFIYSSIEYDKEYKLFKLQKGGQFGNYGVADLNGKIIVPVEFPLITILSGAIFLKERVKLQGEFEYVSTVYDFTGKIIIPTKKDTEYTVSATGTLIQNGTGRDNIYYITKQGEKLIEED